MVLVVSLNPAVDKTCRIKQLQIGCVNRLTHSEQIAGGKGVNVARVIAKIGAEVAITGFLGGNNGMFIKQYFEKTTIKDKFVTCQAQTRCNTNIISEDGFVTEVLEPGDFITPSEIKTFLKEYECCLKEAKVVVLTGSLPKGVPDDFYQSLIEMAKKQGVISVLDASGEALKQGLLAKPSYVKPNKDELSKYAGKELINMDEIVTEAKALCAQCIENVIVSLGADGMLWVSEQCVMKAVPPQVLVQNTVACGDCAVAVLAAGVAEDEMPREQLFREMVAVSAANATTLANGDIPDETVERIRGLVSVEHLL